MWYPWASSAFRSVSTPSTWILSPVSTTSRTSFTLSMCSSLYKNDTSVRLFLESESIHKTHHFLISSRFAPQASRKSLGFQAVWLTRLRFRQTLFDKIGVSLLTFGLWFANLVLIGRRKWPPTPVFLPGEPHRQKSLAGYSPWGHESRTRPSD